MIEGLARFYFSFSSVVNGRESMHVRIRIKISQFLQCIVRLVFTPQSCWDNIIRQMSVTFDPLEGSEVSKGPLLQDNILWHVATTCMLHVNALTTR